MRHGSCMTFLPTQSASSKTEAFWHCPKARLEVLPLHCQLVRAGTRFPLPSLNAVCLLGLSLSRCQDWSLWLCRQGRSLCLLVLQGRSLCSWRRHRQRGWFSCRLSLRLCLQLLSCCLSLQKLRLCLPLLLDTDKAAFAVCASVLAAAAVSSGSSTSFLHCCSSKEAG